MTKSKLIQILLGFGGCAGVVGGTGYLSYNYVKIKNEEEAMIIKSFLEKIQVQVSELIPNLEDVPSKTLTLDKVVIKIENIKKQIQNLENNKHTFENYDDLVGDKITQLLKVIKNIENKISLAKSKIKPKIKTN